MDISDGAPTERTTLLQYQQQQQQRQRRLHQHPPFPPPPTPPFTASFAKSSFGAAVAVGSGTGGSFPGACTSFAPYTPQFIPRGVLTSSMWSSAASTTSSSSSVSTILMNSANDSIVNDCLITIFSFLPTVSALCRVSETCKHWRRVATSNYFWDFPLRHLESSCKLPPPGGEPYAEMRAVCDQFEHCRGGLANKQLTLEELEEIGDAWGTESHADFFSKLRSYEFAGGTRWLERVRNFLCMATVSSWVDRFAVPFILVFFAVTFIFGTIPDEEEHGYQELAVCIMTGNFRHVSQAPEVAVQEVGLGSALAGAVAAQGRAGVVAAAAAAAGGRAWGGSSEGVLATLVPQTAAPYTPVTHVPHTTPTPAPVESDRGSLGFDWMIQQLVLVPLVAWRLTAWSRSPSLVVAGTAMRSVHVFLAVAPLCITLMPKLHIPYSVALLCLHIAVLVEWSALLCGLKTDHPDWHDPLHSPWRGFFTEECRKRLPDVTVLKVVAIHALVVLMLDVVLLVWTLHLDVESVTPYAIFSPYWAFSILACLICVGFCVLVVRSRFNCFTGIMGLLTSLFVLLSLLAVPIPLEDSTLRCK